MVRFPNWLYHPSKLFLHHEYGPFKTNIHPKVFLMLYFFIIPLYLVIYETNIVSFFNVNVLTNSFCIKECLRIF